MIFSKNKKPTEPGRYWARLGQKNKEPFTVMIDQTKQGLSMRMTVGDSSVVGYLLVSILNFQFGDRIETPTVEAK